ncbi:MCE family protein [Desulfobulbus rhabdoformis]|uniref:MlaD family protein n=1 Tax=Desulfobulbus rhabdoformis TaxID=34032 RepID=UPI001963ACBE|nr:MlaD family protein [Desulfobulbus rhabdoformis]MBM9614182.1 MCE family protein [Desulfobulbus rhabdoformis]
MSKKANPTLIGGFVLVALAITVVAIIILGQVQLRDQQFRCVAYFTGSLYGLDVGAPVTFRGVNIGRVSEVQINFDQRSNTYLIPVAIDIEQAASITGTSSKEWDPDVLRTALSQMIANGLRAQLKMTSFLTGKLYIDLALHPENTATYRGNNSEILEIPTMPSGLEQITQTIESLPLSELLAKAGLALDGLNQLISSRKTHELFQSASVSVNKLNTLLLHVDEKFPELADTLQTSIRQVGSAAQAAKDLLKDGQHTLPGLSKELHRTLMNLNKATGSLSQTLANLQQLTAKDSTFIYQLESSLREIEQTATSIREVSDYLQQNPNALIFGPREVQ